MHILFVDESGTPPGPESQSSKYFVVGGIIIPEGVWHRVRDALHGLKVRYSLRGEIKWRHFAPGNSDKSNPMRSLPHDQRNAIRYDIIRIITSESAVTTLACVCSISAAYQMQSITSSDDLYHGTYKPVTERFQYYLQDLSRMVGSKQYGIIVADHRGRQDDKRLRLHHQKLLYSTGASISRYNNLIEGVFLQPSELSIGIQLADIVAGSVWRKYERDDPQWYDLIEPSVRRSRSGAVDGHGVVKFPKANWE